MGKLKCPECGSDLQLTVDVYGDKEMNFLDAVLIARTRISQIDLDRYCAPDIVLAIKTIINGIDDELHKAEESGYVKGYMAAEKEKDKIIESIMEKWHENIH